MPLKILIVEDDAIWQMRFRERLEEWGYDVVLAGNKSEGQLKLRDDQNGFDVLLIDPSLTETGDDKDGLEFLLGLRKLDIVTPAIIFTQDLNKKLLRDLVNEYADHNIIGALDKGEFTSQPEKVMDILKKAEKKSIEQKIKLPTSQSQDIKEITQLKLGDKTKISIRDAAFFFGVLAGLIILWMVGFNLLNRMNIDPILIFAILLVLTAFAAFVVNILSENGLIRIVQMLKPWGHQTDEEKHDGENKPAS